MERVEGTVRGDQASQRPSAFTDLQPEHRESYAGDGFVVLVIEAGYRLELVEFSATVVMDLIEEHAYEVTILGGDGGARLSLQDQGGESEEARKLRRRVERFCEESGLTVEQE